MAVPIADPKAGYLRLQAEISAAVQQVFESCRFILGPNVAALEDEVPAACGARFGIAVNSGTDAIVIALAANGIGPGDEVITTPFTFVATSEAVMIVGAKPVYVDIEPETFNIDCSKIESCIGPRTKAILPVHLYGQCADMRAMESIARKHGLKLIADAAQAIGARHAGKGVGAFGDAATLSFYPTKNLGACGDGGMVLTNSEDVAARARSLRFHGMDGSYSYRYVGFCSRLDEIQAAILRVKLKHLEEFNEARRQHAARYMQSLSDLPLTLPEAREENYHTCHQFTVRFARRDELRSKLEERGIGSAVFYPSPLHLQRAYAGLGYREGDFPESERACREVLSLPVYPELEPRELDEVVQAVRDSVKELGLGSIQQ